MKSVVKLSVFVALLSLTACSQADFKKTKSGLPYQVVHSGNDTTALKEGDIIKFNVITKLDDSVLYTSYNGLPEYMPVRNTGATYDFMEILPELKKGDSVYAIQAVDTLLEKNPNAYPPQFKKGSRITTQFKIIDVFADQRDAMEDRKKEEDEWRKKEEVAVEAFIKKNNIKAEKTEDGVYVETLAEGNGPAVETGKDVSVMYTGETFEGTRFDSNIDSSFHHTDPLKFIVGRDPMIPGFVMGIMGKKPGAKINVYMPSMLGYGGQTQPGSKLKPYDNLKFYIEVLDVTDPQPQPQPSATPPASN